MQFTFEKNNLFCKNREKITCRREKSQPYPRPPPPGHQMVRPLNANFDCSFLSCFITVVNLLIRRC